MLFSLFNMLNAFLKKSQKYFKNFIDIFNFLFPKQTWEMYDYLEMEKNV